MLRIRSCARWLAAAWLVGQIAMVAITAGAIEALPARSTVPGHCECPGNPETATCPMHGKKAPKSPHHDCAIRQTSTPPVALLSASTNFPIVPRVRTFEPARATSPVQILALGVRDRSIRPEAPPPRG
jgi:hypothetical protein